MYVQRSTISRHRRKLVGTLLASCLSRREEICRSEVTLNCARLGTTLNLCAVFYSWHPTLPAIHGHQNTNPKSVIRLEVKATVPTYPRTHVALRQGTYTLPYVS